MALDPSAVYDLASDLLDSVVARMNAELDVALPTRQYVHAGDETGTAFDCEQVVVTVNSLVHAFPGEAAKVEFCSPPRHVNLQVWVVRCVPSLQDDGQPPTVTALDEAAQVTLADLWTLAYVLWAGYKADEWGGACSTVLLGPVEIVGPEGAYSAVKANVSVLVT